MPRPLKDAKAGRMARPRAYFGLTAFTNVSGEVIMRFSRSLAIVVALVVCTWTAAQADRGGIPFKRNVTIYEPNQRAVVACERHGRTTPAQHEPPHVRAERGARESPRYLRNLKCRKGDLQVFVGLTNLINEKLRASRPPRPLGKGRIHISSGGAPAAPRVRLPFMRRSVHTIFQSPRF